MDLDVEVRDGAFGIEFAFASLDDPVDPIVERGLHRLSRIPEVAQDLAPIHPVLHARQSPYRQQGFRNAAPLMPRSAPTVAHAMSG